jgi:hypothetical protein
MPVLHEYYSHGFSTLFYRIVRLCLQRFFDTFTIIVLSRMEKHCNAFILLQMILRFFKL